MNSSMSPSASDADAVLCPNCASQLLVPAGVGSLVCANCHTQFRLDGPWPQIRFSRKAIISCVLGILSFMMLFLTGIPALILGVCALSDIRRQTKAAALKGRWLAIVGALLGGTLSSVIFVGPIVVARLQRAAMAEQGRQEIGAMVPQALMDRVVAILPHGAEWKWFHPTDGLDPEIAEPGFQKRFSTLEYDDSKWKTARELDWLTGFGYGDPVAVPIGKPVAGDRNTAYFRARFHTDQEYRGLIFTCYRDDGVIIYLDGKEVARSNVLSDSEDTYEAMALKPVTSTAETARIIVRIPGGLSPGAHVLAISLHNVSNQSSDLRLGNLCLYGTQ
ncbi:MAG: DUF4190 domain-containing protein [Planctomycetaceae bacterium]|nr:DUF4190 domain-containing protein [Planctomycetaceae bacterium]